MEAGTDSQNPTGSAPTSVWGQRRLETPSADLDSHQKILTAIVTKFSRTLHATRFFLIKKLIAKFMESHEGQSMLVCCTAIST